MKEKFESPVVEKVEFKVADKQMCLSTSDGQASEDSVSAKDTASMTIDATTKD